jgi:hypothetical protein
LPEGIVFKKPGQYGLKQVKQIMERANDIRFTLTENSQVDNERRFWQSLNEDDRKVYRSILCKIANDEKVSSCILKNELIMEPDMVTANLDLSKKEFDILMTKLKHVFDKDALTSLTANYEHSKAHNGYILPVYTDTEDPYWLFYYPGSGDAIEAWSHEDKIWGYWLDKTDEKLTYNLMKNLKTFVMGVNLICFQEKELGSLRYRSCIVDTQITIPLSFDKCILQCLAEQNFL